jgi:hypothetical protein
VRIRKDASVEIEPVIDRDTSGLTGAPEIAAAIFGKIDMAQVFVCDVSIIGRATDKRPTPNPNVLVELGYALKKLGWERVVLVMNTAFGSPEDLPFDLRSRRVLSYNVSRDTPDKATSRNLLSRDLESAIRGIISLAVPDVALRLTAMQKLDQYARLTQAVNRGDFYTARDLLQGLEGYRPEMPDIAARVQRECERLDTLANRAADALANNDHVHLIRAVREMGAGASDTMLQQARRAWQDMEIDEPIILHEEINVDNREVVSISISRDSQFAAVGLAQGAVWLLNLDARAKQEPFAKRSLYPVDALAMIADPDIVWIFTPYTRVNISRWNYHTGNSIATYEVAVDPVLSTLSVSSLALSLDEQKLLVGYNDGRILVRDVASQYALCWLNDYSGEITTIAPLPNPQFLLSGSSEGTVKLWDLTTCHRVPGAYSREETVGVIDDPIRVLSASRRGIKAMAITPDARKVVTLSTDSTLHVWDLTLGEIIREVDVKKPQTNAIVVTPDGNQLITGTREGRIIISDLVTGDVLRSLQQPVNRSRHPRSTSSSVEVLAISPDGTKLLSGSDDGVISMWHIPALAGAGEASL